MVFASGLKIKYLIFAIIYNSKTKLLKIRLLILCFSLGLFIQPQAVRAQQSGIFLNGNLGIGRNYLSLGFKEYRKGNVLFTLEAGGGILGEESEFADAGNSPNISGLNGFTGSIASSVVIPKDPNTPSNMYPGSVNTRYSGFFVRAGYEWRFPSTPDSSHQPKGLRAGVELGVFIIGEHQDIQYRSFSSSALYMTSGTASCAAIAPGLCLGYDLPLRKKLQLSPELALPFYIPAGSGAKTNGAFAKAGPEARLSISWFFR